VTLRRLGQLQWIGLAAGVLAWSVEHIAGYALTAAECGSSPAPLGLGNDWWQGIFMAAGIAVLTGAELCAITVLRRTRHADPMDVAPARMRFFAISAVLANGLLLWIVVLSGIASIADPLCRNA
jgi:hypothetical protein